MSQHSSRGGEWERLRKAVLERDGWACTWCGKHLEGADATVDHLVSRAKGGEDSLTNTVACCRSCNASKGVNDLVRSSGFNNKWLDRL